MSAVDTRPPTRPVPGSVNRSLGQHVRDYWGRVRGGDIGGLPAILGLVVLCIVFGSLRPRFLSVGNFTNLFTQGAPVTIIAMGLVFVLLLGEIDLSAGFASGVCATIMSVLLVEHHVPWYLSVLAAIVTGVVIGTLLGLLVAKVRVPSFVVTLAGFLAFQGVVLEFLSGGKNISVSDPVIIAIENKYLPPLLGWVLLVLGVVGYAAVQLISRRNRLARGLGSAPVTLIIIRVLVLAVLGGLTVYILNLDRSRNPGVSAPLQGVPIVVPLIAVLLLIWMFVLGRTAYGRHIYAVGGNREAARRAGINVDAIRISAFVICSGMAAIGGIVAVSRANSVDPNTGGSNILLYAVGAAVIGGTSLFGGKGRILNAILGGAVIAVIENGMGLMQVSAGTKYIFTGGVLLLAAGVDALSRRRAAAAGLR
jgi:D-xylose transport system permease protein